MQSIYKCNFFKYWKQCISLIDECVVTESLSKEWRRLSKSPLVQMFSLVINWHLRIITVQLICYCYLLIRSSGYFTVIYITTANAGTSPEKDTIFGCLTENSCQELSTPLRKYIFVKNSYHKINKWLMMWCNYLHKILPLKLNIF